MAASLAATAVGDYRDADDRPRVRARGRRPHLRPRARAAGRARARSSRPASRCGPGPTRCASRRTSSSCAPAWQELGMPQPEWAAVTDADGAAGVPRRARRPRRRQDAARRLRRQGRARRVRRRPRRTTGSPRSPRTRAAAPCSPRSSSTSRASSRSRSRGVRPARCASYPVVETVQRGRRLRRGDRARAARGGAARARSRRGSASASPKGSEVTGMLAVELFETTDERLLVNELAMRPHNSGHWTQDGAVTSQFEQHLRAVLDLPLGDPAPTRGRGRSWSTSSAGPPTGALDERFAAAMAAHPGAKIHTYGKAPRPGRKVGHVNVAGRRPRRRRVRGAGRGIPLPGLSACRGTPDGLPRPRRCGVLPASPPSLVG